MLEVALAAGIAALLLLAGVSSSMLSWQAWLKAGIGMVAVGLLVSLPGGLLYHMWLVRALKPLGKLDRGWIWHPTRLHRFLEGEPGRRTMLWFMVGAAGWGVAILGCIIATAALVLAR